MTGRQFKAYFVNLYGSAWALVVAFDLEVSRRTVQRWAKLRRVPKRVLLALAPEMGGHAITRRRRSRRA